MNTITIFSTAFQYGLWIAAAAIALALVYALAYRIYKRAFHGTRSLSLKQWIVLILLSVWFLAVLGLTTFSREANYTGRIKLTFFSGYINAWNQWSYSELQLVIFNVLLFAPLGFLLPFLLERGKKLSFVCIVSFSATLFIESLQLVTGRGIFDLDDLFHNLVGSLFGYFVSAFILDCIAGRKGKAGPLLRMLAIPLVFAAGISAAVILYHTQEYGNWAFLPDEKQDMSIISLENSAHLSDETAVAPVFRNSLVNHLDNAGRFSEALADLCGIKLRKTVKAKGSDRVFEAEDGGQITYFTRKGFFSYISRKEPSAVTAGLCEIDRKKIEAWLSENGLLPEDAKFTLQDHTILRWDIEANAAETRGEDFASGLIMVQFDAANEIASFDYQISQNRFVATEKTISSKQAYSQVLSGNFEQYTPLNEGDRLCITDCRLACAYDTKGYYRPVYLFTGFVNEKENRWWCRIPAEKRHGTTQALGQRPG